MVWEVKCVRFYAQTEEGDPSAPLYLLVARNALNRDEIKYFLSNAPPKTRVALMLLIPA